MNVKTIIAIVLAVSVVASFSAAAHPGVGKYQDVDRAIAHGYVTDGHCVPGMGYHYVNFGLVDGEVEVSNPEVLVYANGEDGLELVAAEYLAVAPFELFGHESEPGPFPGSYALHAWFFLPNAEGLTHHTNPRVDANCNVV